MEFFLNLYLLKTFRMDEVRRVVLSTDKSEEALVEDTMLPIELKSDFNIIDEMDISGTVDLYEQYLKERDSCTKYRLIVTISEYISNVLFNPTTMVFDNKTTYLTSLVMNRLSGSSLGTYSTSVIYSPTQDYASYTTSLTTSRWAFLYGYDVFDNIVFRSSKFKKGNKMDAKVPKSDTTGKWEHTFLKDDINSIADTINNNLVEVDGWLGFTTPTKLLVFKSNITSEADPIDPAFKNFISDTGNCEFNDMFPTRNALSTCYSVINEPGFNFYAQEESWKYYLTYPYSNVYDHWLVVGGMPCIKVTPYVSGQDSNPVSGDCIVLEIPYNHGVKKNDTIRFFFTPRNGTATQRTLKVIKVPNSKTLVVPNYDTQDFINTVKEPRIKRTINDVPCVYYIRVFRRIPFWGKKNENITLNNINIKLKENETTYENFSHYRYNLAFAKNIYNDKQTQVLFSDSVDLQYLTDNLGRPLSEIYFTIIKNNENNEDSTRWRFNDGGGSAPVDITKDASGNKYLTQFQKYFSRGSTGFELAEIDGYNKYFGNNLLTYNDYKNKYPNVFTMHNLDKTQSYSDSGYKLSFKDNTKTTPPYTITIAGDNRAVGDDNYLEEYPASPKSMEVASPLYTNSYRFDDEKNIFYYGDICELDIINYKETILSTACNRFNTAQRESFYVKDTIMATHNILFDDLDKIILYGENNSSQYGANGPSYSTEADSQYIPATGVMAYSTGGDRSWGSNTGVDSICASGDAGNKEFIWRGITTVGPRPEGYYHQAHYPITLKWYSSIINTRTFLRLYINKNLGWKTEECNEGGEVIKYLVLFSTKPHMLVNNSIIRLLYKGINEMEIDIPLTIRVSQLDEYKIMIPYTDELKDIINSEFNKMEIRYFSTDTPLYAKHIGNGKYVWRDLLKNGESDDLLTSHEEFPFTNGNFYINKQIMFHLRRQGIGSRDMMYTLFPNDLDLNLINLEQYNYQEINENC
jgi:hypothetical protein